MSCKFVQIKTDIISITIVNQTYTYNKVVHRRHTVDNHNPQSSFKRQTKQLSISQPITPTPVLN